MRSEMNIFKKFYSKFGKLNYRKFQRDSMDIYLKIQDGKI